MLVEFREDHRVASFTEDVRVVNRLSGRVHGWELCEVVSYYLDEPGGDTVHVPPQFETDFASVPRPIWFWIAPWGRHGRAAIVHDFLYQRGSITRADGTLDRPSRREADRIFRDAMAVLDVHILSRSKWSKTGLLGVRLALAAPRRFMMWAAVALFGFRAYERQQAVAGAPPKEQAMYAEIVEFLAAG